MAHGVVQPIDSATPPIGQGIADMVAGRGKPLDEAFAEMQTRLGFPPAKQ